MGLDGTYIFQSLIADDLSSVGISQQVEGLTPGYYRLSAMVGTDADATVTLFAGDSSVSVNGHPFGTYYLAEAVIDSIRVEASEGIDTGVLTIGIQEGHRYKADDFRLFYMRSLTSEEDPLGIDDISATEQKFTVVPVQGGVRITAPTMQTIAIYAASGTSVFRKKVLGTEIVRLPQGIYIVGGKKVMVLK